MLRLSRTLVGTVPQASRAFIVYWIGGALAAFAMKKGITAILDARRLNRDKVDERFEIRGC